MSSLALRLARFHRIGAPGLGAMAVHAVALSADGELALVGAENGLHLVRRDDSARSESQRSEGRRVRPRARGEAITGVALAPDRRTGFALERTGRLQRLEVSAAEGEMRVSSEDVWEQRNDLYSLDFHAQGEGEEAGGIVALGHHDGGLTALDEGGRLLWRLGPQSVAAEHARTWHAAISPDGRTIYAAALGTRAPDEAPTAGFRRPTALRRKESAYILAAIDARVGKPRTVIEVSDPVTLLAALPAPLGVAAVHRLVRNGDERASMKGYLVAYEPDLKSVAWTLLWPEGETVTALACAPEAGSLLLGTDQGRLWRVGAFTGRILARYDLLYYSTVLSVAVSGRGDVAAGLANGHVAFLERARSNEAG